MKNARIRERFFARLDASCQFTGLFDLLPGVSFFVKDRRGRFMAMNRRGCEYCGIRSETDAIGLTDHDFFPKQRADEYRADDVAVMTSGEAIVNRIESAPEAAGSPRLVMTSKIPLRDQRGKIIGTAGFSRQVDQIREQSGTIRAFSNVIEHMHHNFDSKLTTQSLAEMANLSVRQFERRFRKAFGMSVRQYLLRVRIENGARMLVETSQTVSQVAQACGFYDHAHFSRSFRRQMSLVPSAYRKLHRVMDKS